MAYASTHPCKDSNFLSEIIEVGETYVGGLESNRHASKVLKTLDRVDKGDSQTLLLSLHQQHSDAPG